MTSQTNESSIIYMDLINFDSVLWINKLGQVHSKKRTTCLGLLKTALNNVFCPICSMLLTILFSIVTPDRRLFQAQQCQQYC